MIVNFWGFKKGQGQVFDSEGKRMPVTFIKAKPVVVARIWEEKESDWRILVGVGEKKEKRVKKPILGIMKKAKLKVLPGFLKELRVKGKPDLKPGEKIKVEDVFKKGDKVVVSGISSGKGFAGVMKRWGFKGGPRTHGQSDRERAPGSIGQTTTPGRVYKGKKMPGRMGGVKKTVLGLEVIEIDTEKREIVIKGLVPGVRGGLVNLQLMKRNEEN